MTRLALAVLAVLAALGLAYGTGRHQGRAALQASLDAAQVKADAAAAEMARALAVSEQNRRAVAAQLEDAANAQPVAADACLPADRVRRLNAR